MTIATTMFQLGPIQGGRPTASKATPEAQIFERLVLEANNIENTKIPETLFDELQFVEDTNSKSEIKPRRSETLHKCQERSEIGFSCDLT